MEISYDRQVNRSYMILSGAHEEAGFEEKMLRENDIRILLSFYTIEVGGSLRFVYEITGKQSLRDHISREKPDCAFVCRLIRMLGILFDELGKYLIRTDHLYLTQDTIFLDREDEGLQLKVCYFPGEEMTMQEQICRLLEYLISVVGTENSELHQLCLRLYEHAVSPTFAFSALTEEVRSFENRSMDQEEIHIEKVVLSELTEEIEKESENIKSFWDDEADAEENEEEGPGFFGSLKEKLKSFFGRKAKEVAEKSPVRFSGTESPEDFIINPTDRIEEPTVLLSTQDQKCQGRLLYEGRGAEQDIEIQGEVLRIGSRPGDNDAVLHSSGVSRHHARIVRDGEEFYIEDLNSTNGTFVNGEILKYKQRCLLNAMDQIRFADVPYRII